VSLARKLRQATVGAQSLAIALTARAPEEGTVETQKTEPLGELVVAAFDEAAARSADPREVSRQAVWAVMHLVHWAQTRSDQPLSASCIEAIQTWE